MISRRFATVSQTGTGRPISSRTLTDSRIGRACTFSLLRASIPVLIWDCGMAAEK